MLYKLVFVLALLFGLSSATAVRSPAAFHLRQGAKISKLTGDELINAACQGVGDNDTECITTLQTAPSDQKADANGLAFFALRYVENRAENITAGIKNFSGVPDVAPMLQSALTDCMEQYTSIDDLIETAINAVLTKSYADAQEFIKAAISSIELCASELEASRQEENAENLTGPSVDMAKDLKKYNLYHKSLLSAAYRILTVD